MPRHFAQIVDDKVVKVILANDIEFCKKFFGGGEWIETYNENEPPTEEELAIDSTVLSKKNYAGVGFDLLTIKGKKEFIPPKPINKPSAILDEKTLKWVDKNVDI